MNVANAQHFSSDTESIILSPKITKKEKYELKLEWQQVGE